MYAFAYDVWLWPFLFRCHLWMIFEIVSFLIITRSISPVPPAATIAAAAAAPRRWWRQHRSAAAAALNDLEVDPDQVEQAWTALNCCYAGAAYHTYKYYVSKEMISWLPSTYLHTFGNLDDVFQIRGKMTKVHFLYRVPFLRDMFCKKSQIPA